MLYTKSLQRVPKECLRTLLTSPLALRGCAALGFLCFDGQPASSPRAGGGARARSRGDRLGGAYQAATKQAVTCQATTYQVVTNQAVTNQAATKPVLSR